MAIIKDSDAVQDSSRIFSQHLSALTLLQTILQNPDIRDLDWLDLACGKGQIVSQLEKNISPELRGKICYWGYDIHPDHTKIAEKTIQDIGVKSKFKHGDICDYPKLIEQDQKFNFITFTNTAHELAPWTFSDTVYESLIRLLPKGQLYIYDMESLITPELGALPWSGPEIKELMAILFKELGSKFESPPNVWKQSQCQGWSLTIQKEFIGVDDVTLIEKKDAVIKKLDEKVDEILKDRYVNCNNLLKTLCKFGAGTGSEEQDKISKLHEFWAISYAKELRK